MQAVFCPNISLFPMTTRPLLALLTWLALLGLCALPAAQAQTYPAKPIRLVIPFPPAGATDIIGRVVAQKLGDALGQSIVVDNKPGAGGAIGSDVGAKAAPDGYTLLIATSSTHSVGPALSSKLPYDTVKDFTPIIHLADSPHVLVVSSVTPYKSVNELVAAAKAKPGSLNYGSSGVGTIVQLTAEEFKLATKTDIVHVPYKGTALVFGDLATGQVTMMFDNIVSVQPSLQSGKVRPLGVTSARRSALMPNVPTMIEAGVPDFVSDAYFGLWGPAGTPAAVVAKINAEANKILLTADLKERFAQLGCVPVGGTPQTFAQHINSETAKWTHVVKAAGIKPE
ncbi:MAG: extra-cytoplasmic solute receptor [Betaproteobacteria bacterium]|nr:extra-cytoplasmic solute receptor [Betaproteobacteria bacterium]